MTQIRIALTALFLGLIAAPALAGGISLDLPRLQFPADDAGATRGCSSVAAPVCPAPGK